MARSALAYAQATAGRPLTDVAILDLHEEMFSPLLDWAGRPRTEDVGPGGKVPVPFPRVREELRKLADDLAAQWAAAGEDPTLEELANILADTHHRFQWIHPFLDTNGRTGRVLDHFILWSTFGIKGDSLETSPVIVYFPMKRTKSNTTKGSLKPICTVRSGFVRITQSDFRAHPIRCSRSMSGMA